MSLRLHLLNQWLRWVEKPKLESARDPVLFRPHFEQAARMGSWAPRGTVSHRDVVETASGPVPVRRINPDPRGAVPLLFYIHGGAFVMGSPETHLAMVAKLSRLAGLGAVLPRYRLAPEHPFPAGHDDIMAVYAALADHPGGVIVGGDSAGGCLALSLLAQVQAMGLRPPLGCFALSPVTDLTFSGPSFVGNADADPFLPVSQADLMVDLYLQGHDPRDPLVSPLFAGFPVRAPVWLAAGSTEVLLDDSVRMADRLRQAGVETTLRIGADCPHAWPLFHNTLPEAQETLEDLAVWISSLSSRSAGN